MPMSTDELSKSLADIKVITKLRSFYYRILVHALITGLPRSMPNADQNHGIDPKCLSMPINADQFLSMTINAGSRHQ